MNRISAMMERGTTLFLKLTVVLLGIPYLALCVFVVPEFANFTAELYPEYPGLAYLAYLVAYASAIPFYFALYQAFQLLIYIDRNEAFSEASVRALLKIQYCAIAFSGLYAAGLPLFYLVAEKDDAPGLIVIGMVLVFAAMVVAFFAAVLHKLLRQAIDIKSENDLTV